MYEEKNGSALQDPGRSQQVLHSARAIIRCLFDYMQLKLDTCVFTKQLHG